MKRKKEARNNNLGQGTVEYILVVTAVLAVIIALTNSSSSPFQNKLNSVVQTTMNGMTIEANRLTNGIVNQ